MINKLRLISIVFAIFGSACSLISDKGGKEIVFPATEVGTPVGDKVSKEIGPAGGTLISPDGRITLTVPPNAVSEATSFSMQPISNTAVNGMGLGYRLEPSGKTFNVPLQIAVRYDEKDMEGTFAEALTLAYQDEKGAWHSPTAYREDAYRFNHSLYRLDTGFRHAANTRKSDGSRRRKRYFDLHKLLREPFLCP
jgi:hypothetical protein